MPSVQFIKSNETKDNGISLKSILIGGIAGVLISLLLLCLFAFLLLALKISTEYIPMFSKLALISGAFCGGVISAKNKSRSGWLYGTLGGLFYFFIILLIGVVFKLNTGFDLSKIISALLCIISGAVGGILGINMRSKNKKRKKY